MKKRETYLKTIVNSLSNTVDGYTYAFSYNQVSNEGKLEMKRVYQNLGGVLEIPPSRFGAWDIITSDCLIELDEEQHFNRYRAQTLKSSIYDENVSFSIENYERYCTLFEDNCIKKATFGKYWTSPSTEKQFGVSGAKGDFSQNGSTRWKQRAFYDFCRDLYAKEFGFKLVRLSIYDEVNPGLTLGAALEQERKFEVVEFLKGIIDG